MRALDRDERRIISFLEMTCGWSVGLAKSLVAYWADCAPFAEPTEPLLLRWFNDPKPDILIYTSTLRNYLAFDISTPRGFKEMVLNGNCGMILRGDVARVEKELPSVLESVQRMLDKIEERREKANIPPIPASDPKARESLVKAIESCDGTIELAANSLVSFFEEWGIDELCLKKLGEGVTVKILLVAQEARKWIDKDQSMARTEEILCNFNRAASKLEAVGNKRRYEIRMSRDRRFTSFSGLLTYGADRSRGIARFNLRGPVRATQGLIIVEPGDSSLFSMLETYFDEAWSRAKPKYGPRWPRLIWTVFTPNVVLMFYFVLALLLFFTPTITAPLVLIFTYFLRRRDEKLGSQ